MSFSTRFSETRLERENNRLRLVSTTNEVLLELRGHEIDDAVRAGFLDRDNYHFSMFEYARIRAVLPPPPVSPGGHSASTSNDANFDRGFLSALNIHWD